MSSSFVVGARKIFDATEPRFVVLAGDEHELKNKLLKEIASRDVELVRLTDSRTASTECFLAPYRSSKEKIVVLHKTDDVTSWDWLPIWFNKVKRTKLVLLTTNAETAEMLGTRAGSRGMVVDCVAPTGSAGQMKLVKMIAGWYGQSQTQVNLLLAKNGWKVSPVLQLLEKLKLLNQPLTSDTAMTLGLVYDPATEFIDALAESNSAAAMGVVHKVHPDFYAEILVRLSRWLDRMARVKLSQSPMKKSYEIASEVGESIAEVERLQRQGRKFTVDRIARLTLALAGTDKELAAGYRDGVLEMLVEKWQ